MPESENSGLSPEHDPLLDELDLMTHQEAAARFYEQVEELRAEVVVLRSRDSSSSLIAEKETRIADLESTARRIATRRTPFD